MRSLKVFTVPAVLLAVGNDCNRGCRTGFAECRRRYVSYPIYSKWFDQYHQMHPDVQINYQSIGSRRHSPIARQDSGFRGV